MVRRGAELATLIRDSGWLTGVLETVRDADVPDAWVGAGVLRDLVWGERFGGGFAADRVRDVDVAFFDPHDLDRDAEVTRALVRRRGDVPWEATNQAAVHLWYPGEAEPLTSIVDAVGSWPETATSVAVRMTAGGLEICAPLGLDDLLDGVWRRNPRRISLPHSRERLRRHRPAERWPRVRVVETEGIG